jgi:hypothetical protein
VGDGGNGGGNFKRLDRHNPREVRQAERDADRGRRQRPRKSSSSSDSSDVDLDQFANLSFGKQDAAEGGRNSNTEGEGAVKKADGNTNSDGSKDDGAGNSGESKRKSGSPKSGSPKDKADTRQQSDSGDSSDEVDFDAISKLPWTKTEQRTEQRNQQNQDKSQEKNTAIAARKNQRDAASHRNASRNNYSTKNEDEDPAFPSQLKRVLGSLVVSASNTNGNTSSETNTSLSPMSVTGGSPSLSPTASLRSDPATNSAPAPSHFPAGLPAGQSGLPHRLWIRLENESEMRIFESEQGPRSDKNWSLKEWHAVRLPTLDLGDKYPAIVGKDDDVVEETSGEIDPKETSGEIDPKETSGESDPKETHGETDPKETNGEIDPNETAESGALIRRHRKDPFLERICEVATKCFGRDTDSNFNGHANKDTDESDSSQLQLSTVTNAKPTSTKSRQTLQISSTNKSLTLQAPETLLSFIACQVYHSVGDAASYYPLAHDIVAFYQARAEPEK